MKNLNQSISAENSNSGSQAHSTQEDTPCEMEDIFLQDRRHLISMMAYQHAKERGFVPGKALEDWLRAEAEVKKNMIRREHDP